MMVTIYTQVYNTVLFLPRCVESVLNQTFTDFEYILVDNGSTDGCKEILEGYAAQDRRIRLIRFEENCPGIWLEVARETGSGKYVAVLDSDDWLEPDFLESMLFFLERNRLDLAVTGTVNYFEESGTSAILRKLNEPVILSQRQFAQNYPQLWTFPSTVWGNIMRMDLFRETNSSIDIAGRLTNGSDTIFMLHYMLRCSRIGIDSSAFYHYRIRPKQVSRQYNSKRFDSNTCFYETARRFLIQNNAMTPPVEDWLKLVHQNSLLKTLSLLGESELSADEKLAECARILSHPQTSAALSRVCPERERLFQTVWKITLNNARGDSAFTDTASLQSVLAVLAPRCGPAVTKDAVSLFMREPDLMSALYQDSPDRLAGALLDFIEAKQYVKQYDLVGMLQKLAADKPLLCSIDNTQFLRRYRELYWLVWEGKLLESLDRMTGILLEKKPPKSEAVFLQLYLSLAARLEQVPAFLFGKTRLAAFLLRQGQREECRAVLEELDEMGVNSEEIMDMRSRLGLPPGNRNRD